MPLPSDRPMYSKLLISMRYFLLGSEMFSALKALQLMIEYHGGEGKFRDDQITPEAQHPLEVAHYVRMLPNLMYREASICAALLHDVPEDYDVSHDSIKRQFGVRVGKTVFMLDNTNKNHTHQFEEMGSDPIASIVKGADRIRNNDTMIDCFPNSRIAKKVGETTSLILPMLRVARKSFPRQETAYELISHALMSQQKMLKQILLLGDKDNGPNIQKEQVGQDQQAQS